MKKILLKIINLNNLSVFITVIFFIVTSTFLILVIHSEVKKEAYKSMAIFVDNKIAKIINNNLKYEYKVKYNKCIAEYEHSKIEYSNCNVKYSYLNKISNICEDYKPVKGIDCNQDLAGYPTFPPNEYFIEPADIGLLYNQYNWMYENFTSKKTILYKLNSNDKYLNFKACIILFLKKLFIPVFIVLISSIIIYFIIKLILSFIIKCPKTNFCIFSYICIGILILSIFYPLDKEYGFYTFTRLIITALSGLLIYKELKISNQSFWIVIFGIIALLFNPIRIIELESETWQIIDSITIILISVYLWKWNKLRNESTRKI